MVAGPLDGALSQLVEIAGGQEERRLLIVVAFHNRAIQFANALHALVRIRVIPDDVPQTNKMRALALACVRQHRFERL